jgi:hypothetical protein
VKRGPRLLDPAAPVVRGLRVAAAVEEVALEEGLCAVLAARGVSVKGAPTTEDGFAEVGVALEEGEALVLRARGVAETPPVVPGVVLPPPLRSELVVRVGFLVAAELPTTLLPIVVEGALAAVADDDSVDGASVCCGTTDGVLRPGGTLAFLGPCVACTCGLLELSCVAPSLALLWRRDVALDGILVS